MADQVSMVERVALLEDIAEWAREAVAFQIQETQRAHFNIPAPEIGMALGRLYEIRRKIDAALAPKGE